MKEVERDKARGPTYVRMRWVANDEESTLAQAPPHGCNALGEGVHVQSPA